MLRLKDSKYSSDSISNKHRVKTETRVIVSEKDLTKVQSLRRFPLIWLFLTLKDERGVVFGEWMHVSSLHPTWRSIDQTALTVLLTLSSILSLFISSLIPSPSLLPSQSEIHTLIRDLSSILSTLQTCVILPCERFQFLLPSVLVSIVYSWWSAWQTGIQEGRRRRRGVLWDCLDGKRWRLLMWKREQKLRAKLLRGSRIESLWKKTKKGILFRLRLFSCSSLKLSLRMINYSLGLHSLRESPSRSREEFLPFLSVFLSISFSVFVRLDVSLSLSFSSNIKKCVLKLSSIILSD